MIIPSDVLSVTIEGRDLVNGYGGVGLPAHHPVGIGLHSMRERAEELGGQWVIGNRVEGGVQVVAQLPIV